MLDKGWDTGAAGQKPQQTCASVHTAITSIADCQPYCTPGVGQILEGVHPATHSSCTNSAPGPELQKYNETHSQMGTQVPVQPRGEER